MTGLRQSAGRFGVAIAFLVCALLVQSGIAAAQTQAGPYSLKGQFLVAEPDLGDPNFEKTIVLMVEHDAEGAFGIVINRTYGRIPGTVFLEGLGIEEPSYRDEIDLHYGGPVSPDIVMFLHSSEYATDGTRTVTDSLSLTTNIQMLKDIASGSGPKRHLFALGYAGWGPGQLESEIARGSWFWIPADAELVFGTDDGVKWATALDRKGVDL